MYKTNKSNFILLCLISLLYRIYLYLQYKLHENNVFFMKQILNQVLQIIAVASYVTPLPVHFFVYFFMVVKYSVNPKLYKEIVLNSSDFLCLLIISEYCSIKQILEKFCSQTHKQVFIWHHILIYWLSPVCQHLVTLFAYVLVLVNYYLTKNLFLQSKNRIFRFF